LLLNAGPAPPVLRGFFSPKVENGAVTDTVPCEVTAGRIASCAQARDEDKRGTVITEATLARLPGQSTGGAVSQRLALTAALVAAALFW